MTGFFGFLAYLQRAIFCISTNSQNQVGIAIIPITTGHSIGAANRTLVVSVHMNQAYLMTAEKTLLLHVAKVIFPSPHTKQKFRTTVQNKEVSSNMRKSIITLSFICAYLIGQAQTDSASIAPIIISKADSMMQMFQQRNWIQFVRFNHKGVKDLMGGDEAFISTIETQMKALPDSAVKKAGVGKLLQLVFTETDIQCVIEQIVEIHFSGMEVYAVTPLIGESKDGGKNWTFFDGSGSSPLIQNKDIKPNLSDRLIIPAVKRNIQQKTGTLP